MTLTCTCIEGAICKSGAVSNDHNQEKSISLNEDCKQPLPLPLENCIKFDVHDERRI